MSASDDHGEVPYVRFQFSKENSRTVFNEINEMKDKYDVGVYISEIFKEDRSTVRCIYYADERSKRFLENEMHILEGKFREGLLSGRYVYSIEYRPFDEACGNIGFLHNISLVGDPEEARAFGIAFEQYADRSFDDEYYCSYDEPITDHMKYIYLSWLIADGILAIITIFETAVIRKEAIVSLLNGRSLAVFITGRLVKDVSVYCGILALISLLLMKIGTPLISFSFCWGNLIVVAVISLLAYLTLYLSDIKATLGGVRQGVRILYFNYFIKAAAVMAAMMLFTELLGVLGDNRVDADTKETIDKYFDGYCYGDIISAYQTAGKLDQDDPKSIMRELYVKHFNDLKPVHLSCSVSKDGAASVRANKYALEYLSSVISELKTAELSEGYIFLCRKGDDRSEKKLEDLLPAFIKKYGYEPQVIYYNGSVKIMGLDQDTNTRIDYVSDPFIEIANCDISYMLEHGHIYGDYDALLLDEEKIKTLCDEYGINERDLAVCGVGETFERQWGVGKAAIASQITLEAVILFVVMLISLSIHKFTFISKAKELCIKKINGHGFHKRYSISAAISLGVYIPAYVYVLISDNKSALGANTAAITLFVLAVMALDVMVSLPYIIRTERTNISKVLKGGAL